MSEVEYAGLVLEDQLLDHLATPEGAMAIWKERLDPAVIPENEEGIREALKFVQRYIDEYRMPPDVSVFADETGYEEFNEPVAPIEYVIERLRDRYQRQQLKQVNTKIARLSKDPEAALNFGLEEFSRIKSQTRVVGNSLTTHDMLTTLDRYEKAKEAKKDGISFGYPEIDFHLGGLRVGELNVVLARPKRYKSWQLVKSAVAAYVQGHNVAFASMELSEAETADRVHCMLAGVNWWRFQHRQLTDAEVQMLRETAEEMQEVENKIHIFRPKVGERNVAYLRAYSEDVGAEALYIDQLSWFDGAKDENNWRVIGHIMEQLKDASMQYPIYMAAQYNRQAAQEEGIADISKVGLADFIGQTADTLLGIYASKDMLSNKIFHLGISESRSFERVAWEIKVLLTEETTFKCLGEVPDE